MCMIEGRQASTGVCGGSPAGERLGTQFLFLGCCALVFAAVTLLSCRRSQRRFEKIDL